MDLLAFDAALVGAAVAALHWGRTPPARMVPLAIAIVAGMGFALLRDQYRWEDSAFLIALAVSCGLAATIAAVVPIALGRGARTAVFYATVAGVLVPVIFIASIVLRLTACLVTGCDLS
jgi:hypothetical protein